jgi:hypothetical protein
MSNPPLRKRPDTTADAPKPKIWAEGGQRPPFNIRALARAALHLSRLGVAPLLAWVADTGRNAAVNVKNGAGRIPEAKLGRAAPFVPSHLRVAAWIKNVAATFAHASATADPDVKRGNALVAAIEPHLWPEGSLPIAAAEPAPADENPAPVTLPEPMQPDDDPLASIRDDIADTPPSRTRRRFSPSGPSTPAGPPQPPGPLATAAIQVIGYLIGWATSVVAFPYGLAHALWLYFAKSQDLRKIGREE